MTVGISHVFEKIRLVRYFGIITGQRISMRIHVETAIAILNNNGH